jgi:hypothetical protein
VAKPIVTLRENLARPLTWVEGDNNWKNLRDATFGFTNGTNTIANDLNSSTTITAGPHATIDLNTQTKTITIDSPSSKILKQYVKNGNGSVILKGEVVYVSGASGTNILISKAKADTDLTSATTIGFAAQDFTVNGFGYIITEGVLTGINTTAATDEGDPIWLSPTTAGGVLYGMANKPHAPYHMVYLGVVSRKNANNGEIFIKCQNGYELDELHNVLITTPIQDDLLVYNGTTNIWENKNTLNQLAITNTQETLTTTSGVEGWGYVNSISIVGQDTNAYGVSMSSDGTKMYIIGSTNDAVYQYTLSTAFSVSTATYSGLSFSVNTTAGSPTSLFFKPDGTAFYITNDSTTDTVQQFNLSTAWDISTASYITAYTFTQDTAPTGLEFSPDGTKMHLIGDTNNTVYQFALSTPWDLTTTATTPTYTFSVATQETSPTGIEFNSDGTKMYIVGLGVDAILQYNLSTPWNITTAVYDSRLIAAAGGAYISNITDIYIDISNNIALLIDNSADRVFQFTTNTNALKVIGNHVIIDPKTIFNNELITRGNAHFWNPVQVNSTLGVAGTLIASSTITLSGATTSATTIGTAATTGTTTIGGISQTGLITLGQSTATHTLNIDAGATISGATKTINIGTGGVSGSTTGVNIGSATSGATNGITINGSTAIVSATSRVGIGTDSGGSISLGRIDNTASSPYIDFNSGATPVDYDTRITATGGNGTAGNGTLTVYGNMVLNNPVKLRGYTVATLPAGTEGMIAYVADAVAPTYLGALTGGGAVKCPVFYNGSAWVSH